MCIMENYRWLHTNDMNIEEDNELKQFSVEQLFSILKVCLVMVLAAILIGVGEIILAKFIRNKNAVQKIAIKANIKRNRR